VGRVMFFIVESLRALRRSAAPSLAAIVTVVLTTLLLGVFIPVIKASSTTNENVRAQLALRVFLDKRVSKHEAIAVRKRIARIPHVARTQYVSKGEGLNVLRGEIGSGPLSRGLGQLRGNPLPASINVYPDNPDNLDSIQGKIIRPGGKGGPKPIDPAIDSISNSQPLANKIRTVTNAVKIVLSVIAVLLLVASLMLVANTIRLSIYARRREIEVMKLVGATNWFIRWPFVLEGLVVGLSGAAIAVGLLWIGKVTIVDPLAENLALIDNFSTIGFAPLITLLIAAAVVVSALGSGVTLRRFLRV
jgi:cell division transport system permease protein